MVPTKITCWYYLVKWLWGLLEYGVCKKTLSIWLLFWKMPFQTRENNPSSQRIDGLVYILYQPFSVQQQQNSKISYQAPGHNHHLLDTLVTYCLWRICCEELFHFEHCSLKSANSTETVSKSVIRWVSLYLECYYCRYGHL